MKITTNNNRRLRKQIGGRIKAIRKKLRYTQEDFAKRMHISNSILSQVERGNLSPNFDLLYNMAKTLRVDLYHLFFQEGEVFKKEGGAHDSFDPADLPGSEAEFLEKFLGYFYRSKVVRYSVMAFFTTFLLRNRKLLEKESRQNNNNGEQGDGKEKEQEGNAHNIVQLIIDDSE